MAQGRRSFPASFVWSLVFLPALLYYLNSRAGQFLGWSGRGRLGRLVTSTVRIQPGACAALAEALYLQQTCTSSSSSGSLELQFGLYGVQETGMNDLVASAWRHDSELGRGHLLMAEASGSGRLWRWEVGGGPIAVGKTLHLDQAGCRSNLYKHCTTTTVDPRTGAGGIAIDFHAKEHSAEGSLVVAEWGEGRIVRLEEKNGARTPLVIEVPNGCPEQARELIDGDQVEDAQDASTRVQVRRVEQPTSLLYTPGGDLLFVDHLSECQRAALYQLSHAVHVPSLPNLFHSRQAHAWSTLQQAVNTTKPVDLPHISYQEEGVDQIGGIALSTSWQSVYLPVRNDASVLLLELSITGNHDEEEEKDSIIAPKIVLNLTEQLLLLDENLSLSEPGYVAVSQQGRIYWAVGGAVLVLDPPRILGRLPLPPGLVPASLTLGYDGYLYVTTQTSLLRMRVRDRPVQVPTNLILKP